MIFRSSCSNTRSYRFLYKRGKFSHREEDLPFHEKLPVKMAGLAFFWGPAVILFPFLLAELAEGRIALGIVSMCLLKCRDQRVI